jgi:DNA modification methylase
MKPMTLLHGDNLALLATLPDSSIDAVVTDPPYGLGDPPDALAMLRDWVETGHHDVKSKRGFMGKAWDNFVPQPVQWHEVYRVLKPGGHVLAFAGTRTQDLMALGLRLAGFEIRDLVAWVYGCLSEDTEVLTDQGWVLYHTGIQSRVLAYDVENDIYQWEKPERWNEYHIESDTAYHIVSDTTDQIVSRGHRCLVEREGKLVFVPADKLLGVERVPYLQNGISSLPQRGSELLLEEVLRESKSLAKNSLCERQGEEAPRKGVSGAIEPSMERGSDVLQAQGEVRKSADQVREMPVADDEHGEEGRVRDGSSAGSGATSGPTPDSTGVRSPHRPRRDKQCPLKPDAVPQQLGSQEVRARPSYRASVATVTPILYRGVMWCPTVSTGAFVARRNGKVFVTGNSGFPKSHNLEGEWEGYGTALKPALEPITLARKPLEGTVAANVLKWHTGAINVDGCRVGNFQNTTPSGVDRRNAKLAAMGYRPGEYQMGEKMPDAPAGRWPANLIHDGSDEVVRLFPDRKTTWVSSKHANNRGGEFLGGLSHPGQQGFNDTGSAARFFYCAKVSSSERNAGLSELPYKEWKGDGAAIPQRGERPFNPSKNNHPTVKPIALMRYLCRLITPPGGTVLDPWMGSGSTGVACKEEGFRFIGMEQDEGYYTIARARCGVPKLSLEDIDV